MGAFGERSGFIKHDGRELPGCFKCRPVANEQTIGRRKCGGNGDHQRDSHTQCVRAGGYHDRHHPFKGKGSITTAGKPINECAYANGNGNKGEPFGYFVSKVLRIGLSGLCLLYQVNHPVQVAVFSYCCYLYLQRTVAIDRSCDHLTVRLLFYGNTFPGKHTFVDVRSTLQYQAVGRNFFPRLYDDRFIALQLFELYFYGFSVSFNGDIVWQ